MTDSDSNWLECTDAQTYLIPHNTHNLLLHNDPKFLDKQNWANSVDIDQTAPLGADWANSVDIDQTAPLGAV